MGASGSGPAGLIEDDEDDELLVYIDDQELRLQEFGRLLRTYAGWGMRITFVPDDRITDKPEVEVREPDADQEWLLDVPSGIG